MRTSLTLIHERAHPAVAGVPPAVLPLLLVITSLILLASIADVGLSAVSLLTSLLFSIIIDATGIGIPAFGRAYRFLSPSVALAGVRRFPDVLLLLPSLC